MVHENCEAQSSSSKKLYVIIGICAALLLAVGACLFFFIDLFSPEKSSDTLSVQEEMVVDMLKAVEASDEDTLLNLHFKPFFEYIQERLSDSTEADALSYLSSAYRYYNGKGIASYDIKAVSLPEYWNAYYEYDITYYKEHGLDLAEVEEYYRTHDHTKILSDLSDNCYNAIGHKITDMLLFSVEVTFSDGTKGAYFVTVSEIENNWYIYSCILDKTFRDVYEFDENCEALNPDN